MTEDRRQEDPDNWRRLMKVEVSPDLVARMCSGKYEVIEAGVPADAEIVSSYYSPERNSFCVVLSHKSFEPVELGVVIPNHPAPIIRVLE